jgi:hypothetical protein
MNFAAALIVVMAFVIIIYLNVLFAVAQEWWDDRLLKGGRISEIEYYRRHFKRGPFR